MRIFGILLCLVLTIFSTANAEGERVTQWLAADKNNDGVLTVDETSGLMKKFFDRNDADKDGKLTKAELEALDKRLPQKKAQAGKQRTRPAPVLPSGVTVKKN